MRDNVTYVLQEYFMRLKVVCGLCYNSWFLRQVQDTNDGDACRLYNTVWKKPCRNAVKVGDYVGGAVLAGQSGWRIITGGGRRGEVDFGRSLGLRNAILVHEVFKLGGKICHNSCGSQVKRPLEVLLVIQHPNVHLYSSGGEMLKQTFPHQQSVRKPGDDSLASG